VRLAAMVLKISDNSLSPLNKLIRISANQRKGINK
jgi:hypothetical protein